MDRRKLALLATSTLLACSLSLAMLALGHAGWRWAALVFVALAALGSWLGLRIFQKHFAKIAA